MEHPSEQQRDLLARFAAGPQKLSAALIGLAETGFDLARQPGGWTIRQNIHHYTDTFQIWKSLILQATGRPDGPFAFAWYLELSQEEWARQWEYASRPVEPCLALFEAGSRQIVEILERRPAVWKHSLAVQLPGGREEHASVEAVVELIARHLEDHLADIRQIRQAHNL